MPQGLWGELPSDDQLRLREAYGSLPAVCDLGEKNARFRAWLAEQGVSWQPA